jgi:hypothetical protein
MAAHAFNLAFISSLNTENPQVALIVATHNAALAGLKVPQVGTPDDQRAAHVQAYTELFIGIYQGLRAATQTPVSTEAVA